MPDVHTVLILLSLIGVMIWALFLQYELRHTQRYVVRPDKRIAVDRLLETFTHHNELLEELVERLIRIEDHLLGDI